MPSFTQMVFPVSVKPFEANSIDENVVLCVRSFCVAIPAP